MKTFRLCSTMLVFGVVAAAPAAAAVQVLGATAARSCYEAARDRLVTEGTLATCSQALREETLTRRDEVATRVNRGILNAARGEHEVAIRDFDAALALDPKQPEAYLNKALAVSRRSSGYAGALDLFEAAIANGTNKPELAYFGRGVANEERGQVRAAYADYRKAQALAPKWELPTRELARFEVRPAGTAPKLDF